MNKQIKRLIAFCLAALMATAFAGFTACKKAKDVPLADAGFETKDADGHNYYVVPVKEHGSCLVRTDCAITSFPADAAVKALLADSAESDTAIIEKLIYANDEHIYLYGTRAIAETEAAGEDDAIVLALARDGNGWKAEEVLPYAQSLSLFQRIVEETQPLRELTDEELQEAAKLGYNKAYRIKNYGESPVSYPLHYFAGEEGAEIDSMEPIYSGPTAKIYYSPEKSDQVLAELLMRRTAEEENFSIVNCPLVLLISMDGVWNFVVPVTEVSPGYFEVSCPRPLFPYLIERDPETGSLSGRLLEDWTAISFESKPQD